MNANWAIVIASFLLPGGWLLLASHRRFWAAAALWCSWPVIVYVAQVSWEILTRPPVSDPLNTALLGFSLISALVFIPWLIVSVVVIGLAIGLRRVFKTRAPKPVEPMREDTAPSQPVVTDPQPVRDLASERSYGWTNEAISPDGSFAVEVEPVEWYNGLFLSPPRVTDLTTGDIVLDLWGQDWDAQWLFPSPGQLHIRCSQYRSGAATMIVIDLSQQSFELLARDIVGGRIGPAPLRDLPKAVEDVSLAMIAAIPDRRDAGIPNPPSMTWRMALGILGGLMACILAIAAIAIMTETKPQADTTLVPIPKGGFRPSTD